MYTAAAARCFSRRPFHTAFCSAVRSSGGASTCIGAARGASSARRWRFLSWYSSSIICCHRSGRCSRMACRKSRRLSSSGLPSTHTPGTSWWIIARKAGSRGSGRGGAATCTHDGDHQVPSAALFAVHGDGNAPSVCPGWRPPQHHHHSRPTGKDQGGGAHDGQDDGGLQAALQSQSVGLQTHIHTVVRPVERCTALALEAMGWEARPLALRMRPANKYENGLFDANQAPR
jgi:hypothetical protein